MDSIDKSDLHKHFLSYFLLTMAQKDCKTDFSSWLTNLSIILPVQSERV